MKYQIKQANEFSDNEIHIILNLWEVSAWNTMNTNQFRTFFKDSEFHLLLDSHSEIMAIFRLNFDFALEISGLKYAFAEAVGLVSAHKKKGYGAQLVQYFTDNITQKNIDTIGFCHADLRPFYEKCNIEILYDKAKFIKERIGSEWINSDDDDILIFNVSQKEKEQLGTLSSQNNAYLITKE